MSAPTTNAPVAGVSLIAPAILKRLAVSDSGFVFDPVTGDSFTANGTALAILRLARTSSGSRDLAAALAAEFEVDVGEAERDLIEFAGVLRRAFG
jgi:hypothetical protein